jgi:heme/copper-type cytochrome/quinol oxidase subunit 3
LSKNCACEDDKHMRQEKISNTEMGMFLMKDYELFLFLRHRYVAIRYRQYHNLDSKSKKMRHTHFKEQLKNECLNTSNGTVFEGGRTRR